MLVIIIIIIIIRISIVLRMMQQCASSTVRPTHWIYMSSVCFWTCPAARQLQL